VSLRSLFPPLGQSRRRPRWTRTTDQLARPLVLLASVALVIMATTWPWSSYVGHPHWASIRIFPWTLITKPWEPVANVLLFVPLGAALQWGAGRDRRIAAAVAAGLLSVAVETFQLYTHTRIPALPDLAVNTLGGWLGAHLLLAAAQRRYPAVSGESAP
jgi:glycopeptide antibiotics resistance protein